LDRLRTLIPEALDVLAGGLKSTTASYRLRAAAEVLRVGRPPRGALGVGPGGEGEGVREGGKKKRGGGPGRVEGGGGQGKGLPPFEQHLEDAWRELEALAMSADEEGNVRNM